jgi:AraC-like DNA-binding protein
MDLSPARRSAEISASSPDNFFGTARPQAGLTRRQAETALKLIDNRLEHKLGMSELSAACHISRGHFSRAFKVTFGQTPHRFVLIRRVEMACRLMASSGDPLADIAIRCGFNDQPHFTRVFKVLTEETPHAWRAIRADSARTSTDATRTLGLR